jgi:hypothetical protein
MVRLRVLEVRKLLYERFRTLYLGIGRVSRKDAKISEDAELKTLLSLRLCVNFASLRET